MAYKEFSFEAIGTPWRIQLGKGSGADNYDMLTTRIQERADEFDKAYSRFRRDSLVSAMSRRAGTYDLPEDGFAMLRFYEKLYAATNGMVTPLIGQVMADAGYDASYSLKQRPMKQPPAWEAVISYDQHHVTVSQPVLLDFGAAGKGYLVDMVGDILRQAAISDYVIDASGDILHHASGGQGIEVGLENPLDISEAIGIVTVRNQSLCASAGNKRVWRGFHHIIDPSTLKPVEQVRATWVVADDAMLADGLATALFFTDPNVLLKHFAFSYAFLGADMNLRYSRDFPAQIFEAAYE